MSEQPDDLTINPYLTIWTKPRMTIRAIIERGADKDFLRFVFLVGFGMMMVQLIGKKLEAFPMIGVALLIIIGIPVGGLIAIYSYGFTGWLGGRIFKGKASAADVRAAFWWSNMPIIFSGTIMAPLLLIKILYGGPQLESNSLYAFYFMASNLLLLSAAIWSLIIFIRTYQEVQGVSFWRAVGALFVGNLIFIIPFILLGQLMGN